MKRILPLVLCVMPLSALAATPSEILSKGEILAAIWNTDIDILIGNEDVVYDVAYKNKIYRCYTTHKNVSCTPLKDGNYFGDPD